MRKAAIHVLAARDHVDDLGSDGDVADVTSGPWLLLVVFWSSFALYLMGCATGIGECR
jgi:hypothetical protein